MDAVLEQPTVKQPLKNTHAKQDVINRLALNEKQNSIAKDYNLDGSTISLFKTKNKKAIQLVEQQILDDNLEAMRTSIKLDVNTSLQISKKYNESRANFTQEQTAFKSIVNKDIIKPLMQKVGFFPSPTSNVFNGNVQVNNTKITPNVLKMLQTSALPFDLTSNTEVIEVENIAENDI